MPWTKTSITASRHPLFVRWMATMCMGFWIAPVHGEAPLRDANQQAARADDAVRVGAEFFLNRTETADSVARHFRTMKDHGLTIARIFVIWNDIERTPASGTSSVTTGCTTRQRPMASVSRPRSVPKTHRVGRSRRRSTISGRTSTTPSGVSTPPSIWRKWSPGTAIIRPKVTGC